MAEEKTTNWSKLIKGSARGTEEASKEPGFDEKERKQLRAAAEANLVDHVASGAMRGLSARQIREQIQAGAAEAGSGENKKP